MEYEIKEYGIRYFEGFELEGEVTLDTKHKDLQPPWMKLFKNISKVNNITEPRCFIGLNCYPPLFKKADGYDYVAMIQTELPNNVPADVVTKKLPAGKYMIFKIPFGNIREETNKIYKYLHEEKIPFNPGFDYEEYDQSADYSKADAILYYGIMLKE